MALSLARAAGVTVLAIAGVAAAAEPPCPSAADVAAELRRLPGGAAAAQTQRSEVTVAGRTMRVVVRNDAGQVLGVREVEAPRDCQQRAAVAAVMLAAWSHSWAEAAPTAPPPDAAPPPPRRDRTAELGLQAGVHHDGRALAGGGALLGGVELTGPLGVSALVDFATTREQPLGPGAVEYAFVRVGAGPVYRAHAGDAWLDAGLFPQLVRLTVSPRGLAGASGAVLWAGALQARARVGLRWGRLRPFVSAGLARRLVRERLTLDDDPGTAELSPWDLEVGAGVALQLGGEND